MHSLWQRELRSMQQKERYSKNASAGIAYRKFAKELIAYEG